jgi:A/G-specific adenine glycosylase
VWGGLLTAPVYPDADTAEREASRLYPGGRLAYLPSRRHQFTHFTLQFTPLVVNLDEAVMPYAAEGPDRRWLALSEAERAAVPAPLKSLLIALHESAQQMLPLPATAATAESR